MDKYMDWAHFREFEPAKCELVFNLEIDIDGVIVKERINSVRQNSDTVESLLQHTANKINYLIKIQAPKARICDKLQKIRDQIELIFESSRRYVTRSENLCNVVKLGKESLMLLKVFEQTFIVLVNAPYVKNVKLPSVLYSGNSLQPQKLHILFSDKPDNKISQFSWLRSKDKENWIQVGHGFRYFIKEEDVGYFLKLICYPCNRNVAGPPEEIVSDSAVEKMPDIPRCPFEERHKFTSEAFSDGIRVVSYNVLSQRYTDNDDQFSYCPPRALSIDYRKKLILQELKGYRADLICLQEVDSTIYTNCYNPALKESGYSSYYHRKGDRIPEGLACFFSINRFKKVIDAQIVYSSEIEKNELFRELWSNVRRNKDAAEYFKKQATSLQILVLKERVENNHPRFLIVGNTHLFYHPEAEHVRLLQVQMATMCLETLRNQYSQVGDTQVIFCGDFNCTPSSTVYTYMREGSVSRDSEVALKVSDKVAFTHSFNFGSACGEPKFTNYTKSFKDCLDYIFVEKDKVNVKTVVPFPKEEELALHEGLPNEVYPSDHLALVVDLEFVN